MSEEDSLKRFDGRFKKVHRVKLEWIKQSGALSYGELARLVGCNTSTMRNWILGTQKQCQPHFIMALRILLSGALDEFIQSVHDAQIPPEWEQSSYAAETIELYRKALTDSTSEK